VPALASANTALSSAQTNQLAGIVAANDHPRRLDQTSIGSESQIDWDAVARQSSAFLTPAQQAAFQDYVAGQKLKHLQ